jgi:hypothetical protein
MDGLLNDVYGACGWTARAAAPVLGWFLLAMLKREDRRLRAGWTREPPTYYDQNDAALAQGRGGRTTAARLRSVGAVRSAGARHVLGVT